ncbi:helix-turn-helix domain-containing protein [Xanthomonas theicola]|uniref:helix-turn-helix domain-containing protein n=1 Tax=Xanthomonas theicola TaxID=56464 RepID=UPI00130492E8|nr:helix-turn-helix domain-containing protein [Xanthomonas theicola]QNH26364.1 helix-turn-helix domain-containing protein [Xanthomonas theicola]
MLAAEGATNAQIAQQCGISLPMIMHWKKRFAEHKLAGLHDQAKSGRPRTHGDEAVAALLNQVLSSLPETATHWSVRAASRVSGISKSQVARYFNLFGLQPYCSKRFKLSNDPYFVALSRSVWNGADHAAVGRSHGLRGGCLSLAHTR